MTVAVGIAGRDRIRRIVHPDNRNHACRSSSGIDRRRTHGIDHIDLKADKLLGCVGQVRSVPTGALVVEYHRFPSDPAVLSKSPFERFQPRPAIVQSQESDTRSLRLASAVSGPSEGGQQRCRNQ